MCSMHTFILIVIKFLRHTRQSAVHIFNRNVDYFACAFYVVLPNRSPDLCDTWAIAAST